MKRVLPLLLFLKKRRILLNLQHVVFKLHTLMQYLAYVFLRRVYALARTRMTHFRNTVTKLILSYITNDLIKNDRNKQEEQSELKLAKKHITVS